MYDRKAFKAVMDKFEQKQKKNREDALKRRKKVYIQVPQLEKIDKELSLIASEAVMATFSSSSDAERQKRINSARQRSYELRAQKIELLVTAGYKEEFLEENPSCKKCGDKGFIGTVMCDCFKRELKKECYSKTKLSEVITEQNFKNFDLSFYDEKTVSKYGRSPRENMESIFKFTKNYSEKFSLKSKNLLLTGSTGLGKTFISSSIAKVVIDKGFYVIYDSAQNILNRCEDEHFNKNTKENLDDLFECELLIMDDLGAEFKTPFTESALYNIINTRIISHMPTIISTNLSPSDLTEFYHDRIVSRLLGDYLALTFFGKDIRMQKLGRAKSEKK